MLSQIYVCFQFVRQTNKGSLHKMTIYEDTINITVDSKERPLLVVYVSSRGHGPAVEQIAKINNFISTSNARIKST